MARFFATPPSPDPVTTSVIELVDATDGGFWTDVPDPKFVYYNGYTYFGWIQNTTGDCMVASYRHSNGVVSTPVVVDAAVGGANGNPDNHDSPALLVRSSDHKLIVAWSPHSQVPMYVAISTTSLTTDPDISDGFGAATDVGTATNTLNPGTKTYPGLIELTDEGSIYLWWRRYSTAGQTRQGYAKSDDDGATWGEYINVWGGSNGVGTNHFNYRRMTTNGTDRMDLYVTDTDRSGGNPSSLYHLYYDGGNWKQSDGTDTGKTGGLFPADATLIKNTADGPVAPLSCGYDASGDPVTLLLSYVPSTDATIYQARWDGAAWNVVAISDTGGLLGGGPFGICAALDRDDVDTVWFPIVVAGKFEMFRWDSPDSGATWDPTQITSGSAFDNASPDAVWDHAADLKVIWAYGDLSSSFTFDASIRGGY